jgi:ADP-ribose pyrophosphatase YjhB (NUDIX family)
MKQRAAAIIIVDEKILLMRRIRNGEQYFAVPGGTIEEGETPEVAAVREISEETCLDVTLDNLLFEFDGIGGHEYFFAVKNISGEAKLGGPELEHNSKDNFYELAWIPVKELNETRLLPLEIKNVIMEKTC